MTQHVTHVRLAPCLTTLWQAYCDQCGDIGIPERNEQDAINIASRHEEIGGFG